MVKSTHAPANQGRGALQQAHEIGHRLLVSHQQFTEPVEPRMRSFHHPAAGFLTLAARSDLFATLPYMRRIAAVPHGLRGGLAGVALVRTQVLAPPPAGLGAHDHNAVQGGLQEFDIMPIGPADDKGQRDASTVHQQAALGAFFFPDR